MNMKQKILCIFFVLALMCISSVCPAAENPGENESSHQATIAEIVGATGGSPLLDAATSAQVTNLWPVNNAKPGTTSRLWADIMNSGSTALPTDAVVMFYVRGPEFEKFVGSASVSGLAAGSTQWFYFDWAIPASAQAGDYTYWAIVYQGTVEISDWSEPQDFLVGIQAQVVGVWPVGGVKPGAAAKLWANVKNTASAALPGNALVWFYVKGQGIDKFVGYTSASDLATGSTQWYAFDWTVPATAAAGCYQYWAIVYLDNTTPISAWSSPQYFTVAGSSAGSDDSITDASCPDF